jgi:predicted alpha/beta hydrolase family esterase
MKKIYMIHSWGASSEDNWFPWLKKELEKRELNVSVLDMPDSENPKIEQWVGYLEEKIKDVDEETYFIGHSIGCQTIIRFLEKLHKHKKIGGCIFVAGWFNLVNLEPEELGIAHPWINSEIHFERVLDHCNNFLAIFSDDDPYVSFEEHKKFKKNLDAKIIIEKSRNHFIATQEPTILRETLKFLKLK